MLNYQGNYLLKVMFGDTNISIDPSNIKDFTIIQDINRYLPAFNITLQDSQGILTHLSPFDKKMSRITVQIGKSPKDEVYNDFDFTVYRRNPEGDFTTSSVYDIRGLMTTDNLYSPSQCRVLSGNMVNSLTQVANELKCENVDISNSLSYAKKILQPNWTNAELLDRLKVSLEGKDGEGAYQIFIKRINGKSYFVCKSLKDLFKQPVTYKFIISDKPVEDYYPALEYSIFDNYKLFGAFSSRKQKYYYFDYFNSEFVSSDLKAEEMYSLSDYFLIDSDDVSDSDSIDVLGRTIESTDNFQGHTKSVYYNKLNGLVNMWLLTWGLPNITPGDIVQVLFAQGQSSGNLQDYQFSGYWMVKRVIHSFTGTHRTRLLLCRSGVDSSNNTTLLKAVDKRR